jgi:hypothetical protein
LGVQLRQHLQELGPGGAAQVGGQLQHRCGGGARLGDVIVVVVVVVVVVDVTASGPVLASPFQVSLLVVLPAPGAAAGAGTCANAVAVVVACRVVVAVGIASVVVGVVVVCCGCEPTVPRPPEAPGVRLAGAGCACEEVRGVDGRDGGDVEPAIRVVGETVGGQPRAGFGVPVAVGCRRAEVAGGWSAGGVDAEVLLARDIGLALVDDTLLKSTVIKTALITTRT